MQTVHDKESIQALLDRSDRAVIRGLKAIFALQTAEEQQGHHTNENNGVGFSKFDAPFLTDMVKAIDTWGGLTPKQMAVTRNKLRRYHRQLVEIANEGTIKPVEAAQPDTVNPDYRATFQRHIDRMHKHEFARQEAEQEAAAHAGGW
jgi:hypothetical protein